MNIPGPAQQQPTSAVSVYRAIVGIGVFCALLIVSAYRLTFDKIRENQEEFLAAAVSEVLPAADNTMPVSLDENGRLHAANGRPALAVFLGYKAGGVLAGAVVTAEGMGYQDKIRVLYGYSFELDAIVGMKVLDSKETPGLGDRVETEPHFIANFDELDARLNADGSGLLNRIVTVKQGEKTESWQLDGITGATITSEAIGNLLNVSANTWVPVLERDAAAIVFDSEDEDQ